MGKLPRSTNKGKGNKCRAICKLSVASSHPVVFTKPPEGRAVQSITWIGKESQQKSPLCMLIQRTTAFSSRGAIITAGAPSTEGENWREAGHVWKRRRKKCVEEEGRDVNGWGSQGTEKGERKSVWSRVCVMFLCQTACRSPWTISHWMLYFRIHRLGMDPDTKLVLRPFIKHGISISQRFLCEHMWDLRWHSVPVFIYASLP